MADDIKIKELEYEGANRSWDEQICIGYPVDAEAVHTLCADMTDYIHAYRPSNPMSHITVEHLLNWKLLRKKENELLASNAFVLLTSDHFQYAKIQCALFKGVDRVDFLDRKDFSGPLYKQIEEAYRFVLRHINKKAIINDLLREDQYELPLAAIREMIINAVCHRLSEASDNLLL